MPVLLTPSVLQLNASSSSPVLFRCGSDGTIHGRQNLSVPSAVMDFGEWHVEASAKSSVPVGIDTERILAYPTKSGNKTFLSFAVFLQVRCC